MAGLVQCKQVWTFKDSTAGAAVDVRGYGLENTVYFENNTASTQSISFQTARTETGPWATVASTGVTSNACAVMQFTGPMLFVRPLIGGSTVAGVTCEFVSFG